MNQPAITRRRWSSYSLRSLFVIITLMAIGLAWVASERRQSQREMEIAEQLKSSGVCVMMGGRFDDLQEIEEQSWWRRALGALAGSRVRSVDAHGMELTDFTPFAVLTNLQWLDLHETKVSDLAPLAGLKYLKKLWLIDTQINDLSPLARLTNLQELDLAGTQVSDLAPLVGLKNLMGLSLDGTAVSDVSPLAGLKNLQELDLNDTQLKDLSPLAGLVNLQYIYLVGTDVSNEQVKLLQQALPNCKIVR